MTPECAVVQINNLFYKKTALCYQAKRWQNNSTTLKT